MIFKQGDPIWGDLPLGYGPATIGESGCLLTAFAQMLLHYGNQINPATLNQTLKDSGRWVNGDLLADGAVSGLFAGVTFVTKWDFTSRPADLSVLTNNETDEYIIEVDFDHNPNDGIQTHFVRFVSYENGLLTIDDPEYGTEDNFTLHYGNDLATTILKITKYTGPAAATVEPPAVTNVPAFSGAVESSVGTATVIAPANVRTGPGTQYPINSDHTSGGKLAIGATFDFKGETIGQDPYGDGRNKWVESDFGNYVWEGNLTLVRNSGGAPETPAAPQDEATVATVAENPPTDATLEVPDSDELVQIGHVAWLKPTNNVTTNQHEGAPVVNLATGEAVEVVPMETRIPFVAYKKVDDLNYFVTQHMIDSKLDYGIDGLNLQMAEQPGKVLDGVQAASATPEDQADPTTTVAVDSPSVGKIWSSLLSFIDKHHPNK